MLSVILHLTSYLLHLNEQSREFRVKCRPNGELSDGRKAVRLRWSFRISLYITE